ncbi:MAG: peptidylprolyl isomerase [Candidatus Melainabacteria bacterium]|nr:peptidylprolyl isomerase [Candidatus Melainabacteria bacterium]
MKKYIKYFALITIFTVFSSNLLTNAQEKNKKETSQKQGTATIKKDQTIKNESLVVQNENQTSGTVTIQTDKGIIKIKLFTKEAPITTNNFIELIKKGFYNGTIFHRVVENFVIQGGDPIGDGTGNYIDPDTGKPRFIKLETNPNLKFDRAGRVGMARTSAPNSASCQFFIALQALPSLDPGGVDPYGYTVFGQVTDDTFETVKKIAKDSKPVYPGSDRPSNPVKMILVSTQ